MALFGICFALIVIFLNKKGGETWDFLTKWQMVFDEKKFLKGNVAS